MEKAVFLEIVAVSRADASDIRIVHDKHCASTKGFNHKCYTKITYT